MDRFEWTDASLQLGESHVLHQTGVALYDGHDKTGFVNGAVVLTTHRLIWKDHFNRDHFFSSSGQMSRRAVVMTPASAPVDTQSRVLCLPLSLVIYLEEQPSGFAKSAKIVVHLMAAPPGKPSGPVSSSPNNFIRLSFRESGETEFLRCMQEELKQRRWEQTTSPAQQKSQGARHRPGIVGIERSLQQKQKDTDKNISQSFRDLSKLMEKAQEMVTLSKSIANKIKDKQGDITDDETVKFKSYLLSMGIPDPVTRETHGSGDKYYSELAKQLASVLDKPLQECGGMMTLTDVYCRVNRARGMELLSPEDLLNACEMLEFLRLSVRLRVFDSGVMVLQSKTHSEEQVIEETRAAVEEKGSLTAEELAQVVGLSVILTKERLLLTEKVGGVCRDESVEGLRFYPNLFLTKS